MELTYLGTAAAEGIPGIFCACDTCREAMRRGGKDLRTRSQAIVDDRLLIDLPPDTYMHMLRDGVDLAGIEHVIFTHTHSDHFTPAELFYRRPYFSYPAATMTMYGNDALKSKADELMAASGTTYGKSQLACRELTEFETYDIGGYTVVPLLARHDKREKCLIYMIGKDGRWLLYGNDTGIFPDATWQYIAGRRFDAISLDCTFCLRGEGSNHMGAPDLIDMRRRLEDIGCTHPHTQFIATHFSHNGHALHADLEEALRPHGFQVAYDGMKVTV